MHYIRFLKTPRLQQPSRGNGRLLLTAKITITTDLGESFLWTDLNLVVELVGVDGQTLLGKGTELLWKGAEGMRALEVSLPVPVSRDKNKITLARMLVRPKDNVQFRESFAGFLRSSSGVPEGGSDEGHVVVVRSQAIEISSQGTGQLSGPSLAERVFGLGDGNSKLYIWEETGESIARHIWDAGLLLSAYLTSLSPTNKSNRKPSPFPPDLPKLPILQTLLSKPNLNIIELGSGCGIVGITLTTSFPNIKQVLLTDLPEASSILSHNTSRWVLTHPWRPKIQTRVLDWSNTYPSVVAGTEWDLVVVADCTYNPDSVPDLVGMLGNCAGVWDEGVVEGNEGRETLVLVAMKVRHESEMVFFGLMEGKGRVVRESIKLGLPVRGGEAEEIEIFVFGRGKR
ncbi:putative methyltransferase-domain-containing protein [Halenospora varia]|nr:putative methyltransferase-domain-containing protein [Halenospora varia]